MANVKQSSVPKQQDIFIADTIARLQQLVQVDVQTLWQYSCTDIPVATAITAENWYNWQNVELNAKGHIAWSSGKQVIWLGQKIVIPQTLQNYPLNGLSLRLVLNWWAEDAQIFVNGQLVQAGDLFDCATRVLLTPFAQPGTEITVVIRLVSPNHDRGALVKSLCVYELLDENRIDPGFVAQELGVLQQYLKTFAPAELDLVARAINDIDWAALPDIEKFERSLSILRQTLSTQIPPPESKIHLLGHAHLDMAWLWPVEETWNAAEHTFTSVLNLQKDFPELIFCHSTPALYDWIEQHRPDLFAAIQQKIASGCWEVLGGMWIEPDLNLIAGESIVRQILYAQYYDRQKFGKFTQVVWVPDSFGFCATLPQFLKQGGIEYFVTQKLRWNDTTKFPYGIFLWQSPDGSQIISFMSALIGESIDPIKMITYACEWETQTGLKDALWLPGVGDHGGGPTRDMLKIAQRWQKSPFFPKLEFTTCLDYLQLITGNREQGTGNRGKRDKGDKGDKEDKEDIFYQSTVNSQQSPVTSQQSTVNSHQSPVTSQQSPLPIWSEELYLEFHRGCYTTHADQKLWNRRCENLLYQAELFASLATISTDFSYPKAELETAWKKTLFNQFHDIIPGSSITQVFVDANQAWQEVEQVSTQILAQALAAIASAITLPTPPQANALPILIFNPLNWQRSEVVTVDLSTIPESSQTASKERNWQVYDWQGNLIPSQLSTTSTLLFEATDIPSIGYAVFWLCPQDSENFNPELLAVSRTEKIAILRQDSDRLPVFEGACQDTIFSNSNNWVLENQLLQVIVDAKTGDLSSIFDKVNNKEILQQVGGNQLQAFQDSGQYWDAWNIDPNYAQHPLPPTELKSIQWIETGVVHQRLRVVRQLGLSEFCQDYVLSAYSSVLKIVTTVDWQERQVLVKAAFPLNVEADYATYEIPCGAIARTTKPQTEAEKAKWEVPALKWADLTEIENGQAVYGVSLLNDCKYGYDAQPSQLRLTLLRSPSWPDPAADQGKHEFTYAIYPHSGSWQQAHTVRRAYELNLPLQVVGLSSANTGTNKLPSVGSLLNLSAANLILMAFKQSEDSQQQWILRCYECLGEEANLELESDLGVAIAYTTNLLEQPSNSDESLTKTINIRPWEIKSFAVSAHHLAKINHS